MSPLTPNRPPYYGAAYYPEDWPATEVPRDAARMREAGMNVMRLAEFAWSTMEPREGEFHFEWLHHALDELEKQGVCVVLGTPTATPPKWLVDKHPEILYRTPDGKTVGHGGRRHACPHSKAYREYTRRIVTKMAEEFGRDPRVVGWQIDNEVSGPSCAPFEACCTEESVAAFRAFLQARYQTVGNLNRAWCLSLWSQDYDSFDQVPTPEPHVWHHPSLLAAWDEFFSDSYVEFVRFQADILHEYTDVPVGTDMMPFQLVDHYEVTRALDIVQFNHYRFGEDVWHSAFWFDYLRPMKDRPFWVTETATCWAGATVPSGYSEDGYCTVNSWLPFALGAECNMYWLWRTHWAGQELMHGSVLQTSGRPMHVFPEIQGVAAGLDAAGAFLDGTRPTPSGLAVHLSNYSFYTFKRQPLCHGGNDYTGNVMEHVYRPLLEKQYRMDVLHPALDLENVKLLASPLLVTLDEYDLRERLRAWIEAGGTWIAGPMTDIRTLDGTKYRDAPYSVLEEWGGIHCRYQLPAQPTDFHVQWKWGENCKGLLAADGYEVRDAEVLAEYTDGPNKGLAAATRRTVGDGSVILLGTMPERDAWLRLVSEAAAPLGIAPSLSASDNVVSVPRSGDAGEGIILVEVFGREGKATLPKPGTDLVSGERVEGELALPHHAVRVIRYD